MALHQDVRSESGMTLVELLIAMAVMSIGLAAIVAGFSSGIVTIVRAAKVSTAGAQADKKMEAFRGVSYGSIAVGSTSTTTTASNGGTYRIDTDVVLACVDNVSSPPCPPIGGALNRSVKRVTIVVRDGSDTSKVLVRETSTFDASTG
jgi:prepilin-type N-terminal cleavage/methylation domain-containing protein